MHWKNQNAIIKTICLFDFHQNLCTSVSIDKDTGLFVYFKPINTEIIFKLIFSVRVRIISKVDDQVILTSYVTYQMGLFFPTKTMEATKCISRPHKKIGIPGLESNMDQKPYFLSNCIIWVDVNMSNVMNSLKQFKILYYFVQKF